MGTIWKKKKQNEAEREKNRKDERKVLTLTGLLMEGPTLQPTGNCSKKTLFAAAVWHIDTAARELHDKIKGLSQVHEGHTSAL